MQLVSALRALTSTTLRTLPLLLLFAALLACKGGKEETLTSTDGVSEIVKPKGWSKDLDLNDKAELQLGNAIKDVYVIVLTESKADFANPNLQLFSDGGRQNIRDSTTGYAESERAELSVNGRRAIRYRLDATVDNTNITYLHYAIDGKKHMHQVLAWTLKSKFDKNRVQLEQAVASFKERAGGPAAPATSAKP